MFLQRCLIKIKVKLLLATKCFSVNFTSFATICIYICLIDFNVTELVLF